MTNRFALVIAALASLSCSSAIAQAAANPTALPAVTVTAPKADTPVRKFSALNFDQRMEIVYATLEKHDCRKDLGVGFKDNQGQAVIMRIPTQDALEARIEELCKEYLDKADKIAEDLTLDETAAPAAADADTRTPGKMARYDDRDPRFDRGPTFDRPGHGHRHGGKHGGAANCKNWPGFTLSPNGNCELTRSRDENVVKYDRPNTNDCKAGDVTPLVVPLPGGGKRTIKMRCRFGSEMRGR